MVCLTGIVGFPNLARFITPGTLQEMLAQLRSAGLIVEAVQADGQLHRCGTVDKPGSRNGAYVAHVDEPQTIWWQNWATGDSGSWSAKADRDMSASERRALRERIEAARVEAKAEQERRYFEAAKVAANIIDKAAPASANHPYLEAKGIPPLGIFQVGERLIVPMLGEDGQLQSVQFISADGGKLFLRGGKTAGGYFYLPAKNGSKTGPLLVCEGFATAASLHLATKYTVLIAFNAGNLLAVARMARSKYPEREIIVCADNDCQTTKPDGSLWNPGVEAATKAAQAIGGKLAVCPAVDGAACDFNDLHAKRNLAAVQAVIEKARQQEADCSMPEGFFLVKEGKRAGLYKLETKLDGDNNEIRLGPPLLVKGMTRDVDGNEWGLWLEWEDPDGRKHVWAMPIELLFRQGGEWFSSLASGGWLGNPSTKSKLAAFLAAVRPLRRVRCVPRTGWDNAAYVLPDAVFGETSGEDVVLQSLHHAGLYRCAGTLDGWKEIAALAVGNSRMSFALCVAFAGPLLRMAGLEGGGFSLEGGSSSGKTTCLQMAASVWGGSEHVRSWRTTDNGLEGVAALHNDNILILDEVGQVNGRVLAECSYMLSNGQGKGRSNRDGQARRSHAWRLLFLSSGEIGLADKLAENGLKSKGGQEVRFVGIPVEKSMLTEFHGLADAGAVSNRLKALATEHYGHAGRAFLKALTDAEGLASTQEGLVPAMEQVVERLVPAGADGQVRRVAQRFALCCVAGDMAKQAGILPADFDPWGCTEACFNDWLVARGGAGASEDTAILAAVRLFIEQHGASRFQDLETQASTCINRVGFRRKDGDQTEYIILPESFRAEVVKGYAERRAAKVLADAGWLKLEKVGRFKARRTLPDMGRQDVYALTIPEDKN